MTETVWQGPMPELYDTLLGPALFEPYARELARRAADLAPGAVLEVAAGSGIVTEALVRALPEAQVTATDLNPAMVERGRQRAPGARWQVADAQALDLPEAAYDLVVCSFGVMFFPDRPAAHAQVARVLRPGGTYLLAVWDGVEGTPYAAALQEALAQVLPERTPDFVARVPHGYADPEQIAADLREGGLQPGPVEHVVLTGTAPSADALARGYCLGSPLRAALSERGDLDALTARVSAAMTARLGEGPLQGDLAAWVVSARV